MSKITGIVAEYNPFHKGHQYHIEEAKKRTGADFMIVVMSGDFVQRGTPAVFDKYARTKMALLGGADLVLELPSCYACASAEPFASGAVCILDSLNCVDALCFGSESGNIQHLYACADLLLKEPPEYKAMLSGFLKQGLSFPSARKAAVQALDPKFFPADLLDSPNNILGLEYIKALKRLHSSIEPVAIERKGSGYHEEKLSDAFASATAIRKALAETPEDASNFLCRAMPETVCTYAKKLLEQETPVQEDDFSFLLRYALMLHTPESLTQFADVSTDLARRIYRLFPQYASFSQFALLLKTKELTYTRITRALLHIVLNMKKTCPETSLPGCIRILGFKKESSPLLRELHASSRIPLLTKAADYKKISDRNIRRQLEQDFFVSDLYEAVKAEKNHSTVKKDIQQSPVIL